METESSRKIVEDATCTFCGCLCDDITLSIENDRITAAGNACPLGESWFFSHTDNQQPGCLIEGQPSPLDDGIARAARILSEARYPIVIGLCETTTEAQRVAVTIADWAGACIDPLHGVNSGFATLALQEVGEVTCTLGEVKNRADLILFWGCDPVETHPRHLSRFSLEPIGTFVPRGRQDRFCVVVASQEAATATAADQVLTIKRGKEFEALWTLRALAKGLDLDATLVDAETGVSLSTWRELMDRMKRANYGAIFTDSGPTDPFDSHQCSHAIFGLVRDLNAYSRFVCMSIGRPGNASGADHVLTWQTGYPFAVSLARGYPRFGPKDFTAANVLGRGEADAALVVTADPRSHLGKAAQEHLARIPTIVVDFRETPTLLSATVAFRTSTFGINSPGTVYRADGVTIPLRPSLLSTRPSDEDILKRILHRLRELRAAAITLVGEHHPIENESKRADPPKPRCVI